MTKKAECPPLPVNCDAVTRQEALFRFKCKPSDLDDAIEEGELCEYQAEGFRRAVFAASELEDWNRTRKPGSSDSDDGAAPALDASSCRQVGDIPSSLPLLVRELTAMLRETRQEKAELQRALMQPVQAGIGLLTELLAESRGRVRELEAGWFDLFHEREDLLSRKAEREVMAQSAAAEDARKGRTLDILKDQIPAVLQGWARQSDLSGFLRSLSAEELEILRANPAVGKRIDSLFPKPNGAGGTGSSGVS